MYIEENQNGTKSCSWMHLTVTAFLRLTSCWIHFPICNVLDPSPEICSSKYVLLNEQIPGAYPTIDGKYASDQHIVPYWRSSALIGIFSAD